MFNQNQPRVSYSKAIDMWIGICRTFIFSALLEFVIVNWLSRRDDRDEASSINVDGSVEMAAVATNSLKARKAQSKMDRFKALPLPGKFDYVMRILYPCVFLLFNIIYWPVYKD